MIEVRTEKRDNPYVMIDNRPLNDRELSYGARGLLSYLLSKPDDWKIKMHDLVNGPDGAHKVRKYLKELQKKGYAYLQRERDEKGRIAGSEWVVREFPEPGFQSTEIAKNRKPEKPRSDNQHLEKPETGKTPSILSTEPLQRTDLILNTERENAPAIFDPVLEIKTKILQASTEQKTSWKTRFGVDPESLVVDAEDFAAWWISKQNGRSEAALKSNVRQTSARVFQMSFQTSWLSNKGKFKKAPAQSKVLKSENGLEAMGLN